MVDSRTSVSSSSRQLKQLLKIGSQELSYENFKIIKYDGGYNISEVVTISQGGVDYAKVDPKHIYPHLLDEKLKGIILCHNHPSGVVNPSRADNDLTENLSKRAAFFNKEVLDHIIVGKEGVYKYSENDLIFMDEVKKAKEYLETHKTYNCLTGEPINIQTHSSGENKWIGKKDVERYGIEKLEGAKETIGKITYIENNKLYQKSVSFYNISDLKITKEIEQKFVPIKEKEKIHEIAKRIKDVKNGFYLGRGIDEKVAREGSLKMKEINYIHTEALAAGELKHGSIALIEQGVLVVAISTNLEMDEKVVSNIKEVKARGAYVVGVCKEGSLVPEVVDDVIQIKDSGELLSPVLAVVALQYLAYYTSLEKGFDVDKPRNLAKSVTVE